MERHDITLYIKITTMRIELSFYSMMGIQMSYLKDRGKDQSSETSHYPRRRDQSGGNRQEGFLHTFYPNAYNIPI
jgi:hypothetical protein